MTRSGDRAGGVNWPDRVGARCRSEQHRYRCCPVPPLVAAARVVAFAVVVSGCAGASSTRDEPSTGRPLPVDPAESPGLDLVVEDGARWLTAGSIALVSEAATDAVAEALVALPEVERAWVRRAAMHGTGPGPELRVLAIDPAFFVHERELDAFLTALVAEESGAPPSAVAVDGHPGVAGPGAAGFRAGGVLVVAVGGAPGDALVLLEAVATAVSRGEAPSAGPDIDRVEAASVFVAVPGITFEPAGVDIGPFPLTVEGVGEPVEVRLVGVGTERRATAHAATVDPGVLATPAQLEASLESALRARVGDVEVRQVGRTRVLAAGPLRVFALGTAVVAVTGETAGGEEGTAIDAVVIRWLTALASP